MAYRRSFVNFRWSNDFAYIVGLITSDGNLSPDGRHFAFVSKNIEQILNFKKILHLQNKVSKKSSGFSKQKKYFVVQFGDVKLYKFLVSLGLGPRKSKLLKKLLIPDRFFSHFLRGCIDGDGYTNSYWDRRWKSSFRLYTALVSGSIQFLNWVQSTVVKLYCVNGIVRYAGKSTYRLEYATKNSLVLLNKLYKGDKIVYLKRKKFKIDKSLAIIANKPGC